MLMILRSGMSTKLTLLGWTDLLWVFVTRNVSGLIQKSWSMVGRINPSTQGNKQVIQNPTNPRWFWSDLLSTILDTARAACSKCRRKSRGLHARSGGLGLGSGSCCSLDFHTFCGLWWYWSCWFMQNGSPDALRNGRNKEVFQHQEDLILDDFGPSWLPGAILLRDDARLRRDWFQELYLQLDSQKQKMVCWCIYINNIQIYIYVYNYYIVETGQFFDIYI